jgi:transposase
MIPKGHLLRRINVCVTSVLGDLHEQLGPFYSDIGRPSIDPELLIRMLIVGYCFGIRSERKLCEEVRLHLAYRWFFRLDLNDAVPHHSTFSENRLNRFRESDILRHIFERVVMAAMVMGLDKGEGFAVDASVMEANASLSAVGPFLFPSFAGSLAGHRGRQGSRSVTECGARRIIESRNVHFGSW